jgi:hypothetical protein
VFRSVDITWHGRLARGPRHIDKMPMSLAFSTLAAIGLSIVAVVGAQLALISFDDVENKSHIRILIQSHRVSISTYFGNLPPTIAI